MKNFKINVLAFGVKNFYFSVLIKNCRMGFANKAVPQFYYILQKKIITPV